MNTLNDVILADFTTILDNLPVQKCEYIFDCITKAVEEDKNPNKGSFLNNRIILKMGEIVSKYFNYKNEAPLLIINIVEHLISHKYFENIESIKRMEMIHQSANILSFLALNTKKYDELCVNFARSQVDKILSFGKNFGDSSLSLLKRVAAVMLFP